MPKGAKTFSQAIQMGAETFHALKDVLKLFSPEDVFKQFSPEDVLHALSLEALLENANADEVETVLAKLRHKQDQQQDN